MGFLDWLRGKSDDAPEQPAGGAKYERQVEHSQSHGPAPTVPPDDTDQTADEVDEARTERRGEERLLETKGRDDQELRDSRIPPRQA
jgi:hypothetical protein